MQCYLSAHAAVQALFDELTVGIFTPIQRDKHHYLQAHPEAAVNLC